MRIKSFILALFIFLLISLVMTGCGTYDESSDSSEHTHNFATTEEKDSTCNDQGVTRQACTVCGITQSFYTSPLGHSFTHGACERCGLFAPASEGLGFIFNPERETYELVDASDCKDKDVVIPETYNGKPVDTIQLQSFTSLQFESISIPSSVKYIDQAGMLEAPTFDAVNIVQINVHPDNPVFASVDNCLINKTTKTLVLGCKNSKIPADNSVKIIGDWAFYNCTGLESISIPEGVEEIYPLAFNSCTNLKTVDIPSTVKIIGTWSFGNCPALEKIYFSNTIDLWRELSLMGGDPYYDPEFDIGPYYPFAPNGREITVICSDGRITMTDDDFPE